MPAASPTLRRRRLGIELRRLREESGLLIETVARELECSMSKISRIETGKAVARSRDIRDMLTLYGVADGQRRDMLLDLTREAQRHGWWEQYDRILPAGLNTYIGLEAEAELVRCFQVQFIPALLQTADYAREVGAAARSGVNGRDTEYFIAARLTRQERLTDGYDALRLHTVIDESALRRPVGGPEVMVAQLRQLATLATRPNITVQVLPLSRAGRAGLTGPFALLEFPEQADSDLAFVDTPADMLCFQKPGEVRWYRSAHDQLTQVALDPAESLRLIREAAHAMEPQAALQCGRHRLSTATTRKGSG